MRPTILAATLLVASAAAATAQAPLRRAPTNGFDPARLVRIEQNLQRYVDDGRIAGAVARVLRDGELVYEQAVGWADREADRRMTPDAIFRIASQSKAITSAAVMMLVEEGRINLSDPVSRWMPSFTRTTVALSADSIVPARRPITIRDLLTHTSGYSYGGEPRVAAGYLEHGLGYGEAYGWYFAHRTEPICEALEPLGTLPAVQQPGAAWVYGYNTDILGCVVERASGQPLDVFLRDRLFEPLGMVDTGFFLPREKRDRLATAYTPDSAGRAVRAPEGARGQGHYVEGPRRSFSGGAGLVSTARDYARFLEMIRRGGELDGVRYLAPHTVALMTTNQVGELRGGNGLGFGLGFETVDRYGAGGMSSVGSFGWSGAYGSMYEVDPAERLVLVLMIQVIPYTERGLRESFDTMVYQALVAPLPAEATEPS
jgi:CubicO group peptidase (beta-lactamase class C family)